MKRQLIITDLTRMYEGRVCVAGYDQKGTCIRPVLPPPGIRESRLYSHGQPIVFPFALVEYDFVKHVPQPPHTEDCQYRPGSVRLIHKGDEKGKRDALTRSLFTSVSSIFGAPVCHDFGHYVQIGQGARSLGTISPRRIDSPMNISQPGGDWRYRLRFEDGEPYRYELTVTDLTWRYYHEYRLAKGNTMREIVAYLKTVLTACEVYLRIGLSRGWERFPDRCYLQVTGVYTFPDFLNGQIFADLKPALHAL